LAAYAALIPALADLSALDPTQPLLAGFSGIFGLEDETDAAATEILERATEEELQAARQTLQDFYFRLAVAIVHFGLGERETQKLLSLDRATWAISLFALALNGAFKQKKSGAEPINSN
jgi:hypothetical protein